ncbi:MAG: glycosyltransferase family 2 protein [Nitrospirae bacterium]|nr:MAG: glycosyltransferase family 2 protein [Nitrospirota bacterium]
MTGESLHSDQGQRPRLSVVIPVYNERATIEEILRRVQAVKIEKEIIIVDDGSTDGTRDWLRSLQEASASLTNASQSEVAHDVRRDNLTILFLDRNYGKGMAMRRGFQEARGDIVLVQDADLEYDPQDYPQLLYPIECGRADVVYGSRFLSGPHRVLMFWHYLANRLLTLLANIFTNLKFSDVWTGYKVFRREVLAHLTLREQGFGFDPEITVKIAKGGWRVYEVPISYWERTYAEGKKITWRDGIHNIWCLLRYSLWSS